MNRIKTALLVLALALASTPAPVQALSQDSADCWITRGRIVDGNRGGVRVFNIARRRYSYVRPARYHRRSR